MADTGRYGLSQKRASMTGFGNFMKQPSGEVSAIAVQEPADYAACPFL